MKTKIFRLTPLEGEADMKGAMPSHSNYPYDRWGMELVSPATN